MELYFAYLSTYSQKVLLGCYEKNISFSPHPLDLTDSDAMARYREIYPLGKVPLLIRDDKRMIPESSIILEYLDQTFEQGPGLIPQDVEAARRVRLMDRMCDLYLNDPVVSMIFESWKPQQEQNRAMIAKAAEKVGTMYRVLDDQLCQQPFMAGDAFSLADCSAIPTLFYARSFAPFEAFGALSDYWQRMSERPAFLQLKGEAEPFVKAAMGE